jgi:uncharacterized integral membrane protein (TIGR00697 family)
MGGKTFPLAQLGTYTLNASVAILLLPIVFTINDIITEVYSKERARSLVRSGLLMVAFLLLFSLLATSLPPSKRFLPTEKAYDTIFHTTIRIAFASLTAFTLAEFTDVFIFSKLRDKMKKKKLWLRNNVSNIIAQLIDTAVFMFLAFYALNKPFGDNFIFLLSLILPYWLLKCCMSIIETPFVYAGVNWLKNDPESVIARNEVTKQSHIKAKDKAKKR